MDNPGPSRQRLPLDFSQSGYGSNTPHGPVSSSSTQFRRASCDFEHNTPMNMSNFYQRGSATVSYTSTRAAPPWTEVGEGTTPGDTYNPLVDFSQRLCSQRMPNRPRLEKGVSKSLDLGLNPGPSSTLSRRQSLDDTLDLTTLSHPYDPFKTDTDEKIPIQYSQMGQSYVNIESTRSALYCNLISLIVWNKIVIINSLKLLDTQVFLSKKKRTTRGWLCKILGKTCCDYYVHPPRARRKHNLLWKQDIVI